MTRDMLAEIQWVELVKAVRAVSTHANTHWRDHFVVRWCATAADRLGTPKRSATKTANTMSAPIAVSSKNSRNSSPNPIGPLCSRQHVERYYEDATPTHESNQACYSPRYLLQTDRILQWQILRRTAHHECVLARNQFPSILLDAEN